MVKNRKWLLMIMPILVFGLLLAACADTTETTEEPGEVGTVQGTEETEPLSPADNVTETPMVETPMATEMTAEATADMGETAGMSQNWIASGNLIGMPVVTDTGEQIATVSEALMSQDGTLRFVLFDAGGFLGVGERTTAVEWDVLQMAGLGNGMDSTDINDTEDDDNDTEGMDDVDMTGTPESAAGDMTDTTQNAPTLIYVGAADNLDTEPEVDAALFQGNDLFVDTAELGVNANEPQLIRVSQFDNFDLLDYGLQNENGDDLGEIEQLIFNLDNGQAVYAVADVGGFLGIGENSIAIPWDQLQINQDEQIFVLPVDQQTLADAPTIDLNTLRDEGFNNGWNDESDSFWDTLDMNSTNGS